MGLRRALTASLMFAVACGAFLNAPLSTSAAQLRAAAVQQTATRAAAPSMIVGELEKAAAAVKGAAAEQVIRQKVEKKLAEAKEKYNVPEKYMAVMQGLFTSYMLEVYKAGADVDYYENVLTGMFGRVLYHMKQPFQFGPYHQAVFGDGAEAPYDFDYYKMGYEFVEPLLYPLPKPGVTAPDAVTSLITGEAQVEKMRQQLAAGENVVLFGNHQSEADPQASVARARNSSAQFSRAIFRRNFLTLPPLSAPQIFSCLLDEKFEMFGRDTIFVAGDRVQTDAIAVPFSMGRDLLCIYSKKHIENPPELKGEKSKHNRLVMKTMAKLFKEGGKCIWVAPSGGRDRPNAETGKFEVAPFDSKSIEMFRLMADKSGNPTHFYPLSMLTYPICPPPIAVGGAVGEQRFVKHSPAALAFGDEVDLSLFEVGCMAPSVGFPANCDPLADREESREALTAYLENEVRVNYEEIYAKLEPNIPDITKG